MMRYKESIFLLLLTAWLTTSCTQNELSADGQEGTPFTFKLYLSNSGESVTRAIAPPLYEDLSIPVYLYLYKTNEDIPFTRMEGEIANGEEVTLTYWPKDDNMRNEKYDVYAVGYNGDTSDITLSENTTKTELLNLVQKSSAITSGKMYMLSGGINGVDFYHADKTIALKRNACRFSFEIADNTLGQVLTKIVISLKSLDKTYVFDSDARGNSDIPGGAINTAEYSKEVTPVNHVFNDSIYFFEKKPTVDGMLDGDKVLVTVNAYRPAPDDNTKDDVLTYQFYLNKDEGYITRRNTIYKVKAGLSLTEITLSLNTEINWDGIIEDGKQTVIPD